MATCVVTMPTADWDWMLCMCMDVCVHKRGLWRCAKGDANPFSDPHTLARRCPRYCITIETGSQVKDTFAQVRVVEIALEEQLWSYSRRLGMEQHRKEILLLYDRYVIFIVQR